MPFLKDVGTSCPSFQVFAHITQCNGNTAFLLNQLAHRCPCPKHKTYFHLVWRLVNQDIINLFFLCMSQQAFLAKFTSTLFSLRHAVPSFLYTLEILFSPVGKCQLFLQFLTVFSLFLSAILLVSL